MGCDDGVVCVFETDFPEIQQMVPDYANSLEHRIYLPPLRRRKLRTFPSSFLMHKHLHVYMHLLVIVPIRLTHDVAISVVEAIAFCDRDIALGS